MDARMMIRFDVEAYGSDPTTGERYDGARYARNRCTWRRHVRAFLDAARERGAKVYLDEATTNSHREVSHQFNATAYMTARQFHRMLLDIAHTPVGAQVRRGTSIAASVEGGSEVCLDYQQLSIDPILGYLRHVYLDSEYDGEVPDRMVAQYGMSLYEPMTPREFEDGLIAKGVTFIH